MDFCNLLSDEDYYSRLVLEAKILEEEEPSFKPVNNDLRVWRGFIIGTELYEGGVFQIEIKITRKFPFEPPQVKWLTPIFHPNFIRNRVCIGIFGKDWTPNMNIAGVIEALRNLLHFPNPRSPLNREAAKLLLKKPEEYEKRVRKHTAEYASWEKVQRD